MADNYIFYKKDTKLTALGSLVTRAMTRVAHIPNLGYTPVGNAHRDMALDIFNAIYSESYSIDPKGRYANKRVMDWLQKNGVIDHLREASPYYIDAVSNAAACWMAISQDDILRQIFEEQEEQDQENSQGGRQGGGQNEGDESQGSGQSAGYSQGNGQSEIDKLMKNLSENSFKSGALAGQIKQDAKKETDKIDSFCRAWGLDKAEMDTPVEADRIRKLMNSSRGELEKIAELIGRVKGYSAKSIQNVRKSDFGAARANFTRNPLKMFPYQRATISKHAPKAIQTAEKLKNLSHGLLGWRPYSEGVKGGGAVLIVDESGSMEGKRIRYAKAVAIGVAMAMKDDTPGRDYEIIPFSDGVGIHRILTNRSSLEDHMTWCTRMIGGGTDVADALRYAIKRADEMAMRGLSGIDIFVITDGDSPHISWDDETGKRLKASQEAHGTRLFVAYIENNTGALDDIAQAFIHVRMDTNNLEETLSAWLAGGMESARIARVHDEMNKRKL